MTASTNCTKCGKEESAKHIGPVAEIMKGRGLCFRCAFWSEKIDMRDLPEVARIGGRHYTVAPEWGPAHWRGFGGGRFTVRFFDGREVTTTNLWHQGKIPEHFRDELPDNAEFVPSLAATTGEGGREGEIAVTFDKQPAVLVPSSVNAKYSGEIDFLTPLDSHTAAIVKEAGVDPEHDLFIGPTDLWMTVKAAKKAGTDVIIRSR